MKNYLLVNRALAAEKNINYFNNLFSRVKEHSSPTVNRRSTDGQSQRQYTFGVWKYVAMMALLLTLACGQAWGTNLQSIDFTSWTTENVSAGGTSHDLYFKSATTVTNGTGVVFGGNMSTSANYVAIPLSNVCGFVTVTVTHASGRPSIGYCLTGYDSAPTSSNLSTAPGSNLTAPRIASNGTSTTWTIPASKAYAVCYIGVSGNWDSKTLKSITISTPGTLSWTTSRFYSTYASSSSTALELITGAEFSSNIGVEVSAVSNGTGCSSTVSSPHDFTGLNSKTKYYRLEPGSSSKIVIANISNVKSIRLYGNGNGSTRTVSTVVTKNSGSGSTFSISNMSMANSSSTVVEYTTGDLTAKVGYDASTYYTYTISFSNDCDIWGIYVEAGTAAVESDYILSVFNSSTNGTYDFVEGDDENEIVIKNFVIPSYTAGGDYKQFWVGPGSYTGKAKNEYFSWKRAYHQQNNSCSDNFTLGNPVGAIGTFHAWTNSTSDNYGLCFEPNGYGIVWGPDGSPWTNVPFESTSDATVWLTDTVLLTSDMITNYQYYVGLLTNSGGYVGSFRNEGKACGLSNTTNISGIRRKTASGDNWADGLIAGHGKFRIWVNNCTQNFYCHYIPHYVLYFNANGGSGAPAADYMSVEESSITISSTEPTRAGYTFAGWNPDEDEADAGTKDGDYDPEDEVTLSNDLTLYAVWSPKEYTITLNGNGGSGHTSSVSATYNSSTLSDAITNPSLDCYTFDGWYSGEGGSGTLIINTSGALQASTAYTGAGGIWTNDGGVTLYAKWSKTPTSLTVNRSGTEATPTGGSPIGTAYTLTCSASTGSISSYQWKQNTTGSKVGAVDAEGTGTTSANFNPVPSDAGNYWYYCVATDACGNDVETSLSGCFTFTEPTYSVTYNKNGDGAGGAGSVTGTLPTDATDYSSGERPVVKMPGDLALADKTFIGWNDAANGSGTYYSPGANFAITANKTLYAQWRTASSCPGGAGGTVFSLTMGDNSSGSATSMTKGLSVRLSPLTYATVTNGDASFTNVHTSDTKGSITKSDPATLSLGGAASTIILYLDCALRKDDQISFTGVNDKEICFSSTTYTRSETLYTTSQAYTIPSGSPLIGSRILYVWRKGGDTFGVTGITITRPASEYTGLSVTKDPSAGSASAPTISATSVTQGSGVTVTAGTAASGYVFTGWTSENGTFASASSLETTFTPSADNAVATANYAAVKTITLKFLHNGNTVGWAIQGCVTYPSGQTHSITVDGVWTVMTFSNVYAVSDIDLACSTAEWDYLKSSTKIYDDACYNWDGSSRSCDATAPTLVSSDPDNGDTDVNISGTIVLTFSEEIDDVDDSKFSLAGATIGTVEIDGSDATKVNIAYSSASYSSTVTLSSAAGAVSDAAGNTSAALSDISFTTKAEPGLTALVSGTLYKANGIWSGDIPGSDTYKEGLSDNGKFFFEGSASSPSTMAWKSYSGTTLNSKTFTSILYFKEAASVSSNVPSTRAMKFILPSAGSLTIYYRDNNNGAGNVKLNVSGSEPCWSSPTKGDNYATKTGLSAGTYYLYATGGSTGIFGVQFDEDVCSAPTSAVITQSGSSPYMQGSEVTFTASASNTDASTTYTWYRGNSGEAAAKAAGAIQASKTSAEGGNTYTIASVLPEDAQVYYCVISNGTGCEVTASTSISVTVAYTLTYSANTDDPSVGNMPSQEIHTPGTYTLSSKVPTRNGYTFDGWYYYSNYSGTRWDAGASFTTGALNETLYAKWAPNTYTITYNLNGASWASSAGIAEYTCGTGATLPLAGAMTNTGYTFGGWYDNSGLTGSSVTTIGTSEYGNKEFWAKWTENTYTVTYSANGGTGAAMSNTVGHYVTLSTNTYTKSDYIFAGWNTAANGSGASYSEGEEIELKANLDLYAIWAADYTITWDDSPKLSGVTAKPNLGGGNYTITASVETWTGTLTTSMISAETSGVTITDVSVNNSASPKTITATFNVGATVVGDKISFTLDVPANGSFSAKSSTEDFDIDRCTGNSSGSDGVLFSAEFKDSGLGTSDICTAANTPYTFTTTELKAAPTGGSIKALSTSNLSHMKFAGNAISIAGSDGVIQIDLSNAIATNDLFTYVNVNSSTSAAYLRHTSADNETDQIALTGYNSQEKKVMLPAGYNGKTTLYLVRNNKDFKLHKAAVVRPAFLMLLRDDTPTSDTNLEGTNSLTTENYLAVISGGSATFTSPSSGNLKIKRNNSKNYINFNNAAGYVKIELNDALQEGDVIGFDSYNTNNLALTTTATRSTSIVTTNQLYTVDGSSALKDATTFYLWQNSGSSDYLRGLQIARSGVAGGGGGTDKITTTLTWSPAVSSDGDWSADHLAKETGDADFTFTASQDKNSLGAITYSSSNTSVATVNASGKVHIAGAGNATITATMAASGCYKEATVSYNITVTDNCADVAGTIGTEDLDCAGIRMTVTGHTGEGAGATYQWYKDGVSLGSVTGAQTASYTATEAGEYYVVVTNTGTGHCAKASTNTITLEARAAATATKIVDSWYVKNGRRTPDIALVQTTNATDFTVAFKGSTTIWDPKAGTPVTTGFGGCPFRLGDDGIIYLNGQSAAGSVPTGMTVKDTTITITAKGCGGDQSVDIILKVQAATTYNEVAFVVDGTKNGEWDAVTSGHADGTVLYEYLDSVGTAAGARKFKLYERNIYKTTNEKAIREHYSQFDIILITDDPSTKKVNNDKDDYKTKGYVNAFGTMIDVRPIFTMEAYVSALANWKSKGIAGNPTSPNPRQYAMKLDCKDHEIFDGLEGMPNVKEETIDKVEYWTVTMVDSTKSPYAGVAYNEETDGDKKPALQGFSASDVSSLLLLGEISDGAYYAGVERQEEPAARLMLFGLNAKALPNALTKEGEMVIENALDYLLKTNMEDVNDCSNYFTDATGDHQWGTSGNWTGGSAPNSPYVKARILKPCVVGSGVTAHLSHIDIVTSGSSRKFGGGGGTCSGKLTLNAGAALIVGGEIRTAVAPNFNTGDLKPTTENDLVINTSSTAQAALIFDNEDGDTKATVSFYSLGRNDGAFKYQYIASPMEVVPVSESYHGSGVYTYVYTEAGGWERRGYYTDLYAFEGVAITTRSATATEYTVSGTLAHTNEREIDITVENGGDNMIGNSWTAPIQISELSKAPNTATLASSTVYVYCSGRDATLGTGASGSTEVAGQWLAVPFNAASFKDWTGLKVIPAMNAFEFLATAAGTITLNYDTLVRGGSQYDLTAKARAPKRIVAHEGIDLVRIRVADTKTHNDIHLFEGDVFSEAFDDGWEAKYMTGEGISAQLYAMNGEDKMAVLATSTLEGTVLGFAPGREREYTFSFLGADNGYYLNDLKLKTSTPISETEHYTFTYEEGDTNRFYISRTPIDAPQTPTGVDNTHSGEVKAQKFIYNDKMYIMINGRVYSAEGALVK